MADRAIIQGKEAWRHLHRLVRELLARKAGGHLIESTLTEIPFDIRMDLQGEEADPEAFARKLVGTIEQHLDDAVQHVAAFRPGHAFCHRCGGPDCGHSLPPSSRHVLVGYAPTGLPRWEDFAQYCLEIRHADVDRLYDVPPAFVTLQWNSDELHDRLLDAFDNPSYRLLAQLAAGFFQVSAREEEGRGVIALTFQVAASRPRKGRVRLGLNILGKTPGGEELGMLWERQRELPWRRGVRWAQNALRTIQVPPRGIDERLQGRIEGILRGLARRMEREQRGRSRRTRHAEQRHDSGERPTPKALEDASQARAEAFFHDERSGTIVVLGERGRTHFFTPEGKLVSSVRYSRDAIGRKLKQGVWREVPVEVSGELKEKITSSS